MNKSGKYLPRFYTLKIVSGRFSPFFKAHPGKVLSNLTRRERTPGGQNSTDKPNDSKGNGSCLTGSK
jgi:hypothetical protein